MSQVAVGISSGVVDDVAGDAEPQAAPARRWLGRGTWALLDQGLFSGANWLLLFLLARWWGDAKASYGVFVLGWQAFLMFAIFHNAILLDPMLIYGPKRFGNRVGTYLGALLTTSVGISLVGVVLLVAVSQVYAARGASDGATGMLAFAVATPLMLVWWVARRCSYIRSEPKPAALAGLVYVVLICAGTYGLQAAGWLRPWSAAGVLALASVPAAIGVAVVERVRWPDLAVVRETIRLHWKFGKWSIIAGLAILLPERIYYFALPLMNGESGTEATGVLQAAHNLFIPFLQFNAAVCSVLTPTFVLAGRGRLRKLLTVTGLLLIGLPAVWAVGTGVFNTEVFGLAYDGRYDDYAWLLRIMCFSPVLAGVTMTAYPLLASRERPELVSLAGMAGLVFSCTGGLWLLWRYGLEGAAWAMVGSAAMTAAASIVAGFWIWRKPVCDVPAVTAVTAGSESTDA